MYFYQFSTDFKTFPKNVGVHQQGGNLPSSSYFTSFLTFQSIQPLLEKFISLSVIISRSQYNLWIPFI